MPAFPLDHPPAAVTVDPCPAVAGDARHGHKSRHDPVCDVLPLDPLPDARMPEPIVPGSLGLGGLE